MRQMITAGEALSRAKEAIVEQPVPLLVGALLASVLGSVTFGIAGGAMAVGMAILARRAVRRQRAEVSQVLDGFQFFLPALAVILLTGLAVSVGLVLLLIPGLLLAVMLAYAPFFMADGERDPIQCLSLSWQQARETFGTTVGISLAVGALWVLVFLLSFIPLLGGLAALPLGAAIMALQYAALATVHESARAVPAAWREGDESRLVGQAMPREQDVSVREPG